GGGAGSWTYRVPITITGFQQNFLTALTVPFATGMKDDFRDIRFFDLTANVEIPYWIESKTDRSTAKVWIKTGPTNTVHMFYGSDTAASSSRMSDVFGTGLMGFWSFKENVGTTTGLLSDLSGLGNNPTLNNFTTPTPTGITASGWRGNALSLDGSNDWASLGSPNLPTGGTATVEAWV